MNAITVSKRFNNFVSTTVLGGLSAEARFDKASIEDIHGDISARLDSSLRNGTEFKKVNKEAVADAQERFEALCDNVDVVVRFVPDFVAISDDIEKLVATELPNFAREERVGHICDQVRAANRKRNMNKPQKMTLAGMRGESTEDLEAIAAELGIEGKLRVATFAWAYRGATLPADDIIQRQIARRVKIVADSLSAADQALRVALIEYVYNVYLSRKVEFTGAKESRDHARNLNNGQRWNTIEGRVEDMIERATKNASNEAKGAGKEVIGEFFSQLKTELPAMIRETMRDMSGDAKAEAQAQAAAEAADHPSQALKA